MSETRALFPSRDPRDKATLRVRTPYAYLSLYPVSISLSEHSG
jgi:hypothetical protein